jgi:small subunit ribosomal protein S1
MTEELEVNNEQEQNQPEEVKNEVPGDVVEENKEAVVEEEPAKSVEEPVMEVNEEKEPAAEETKKPEKAVSAYESMKDFDWDSIGKKHEIYDVKEKARLEQEYDRTLSSITEHEVIDGTIVAMNNREVVINIGFKSDGVLPLNEFRYNPDLKVGDKVEVYVENQEDPSGQLLLSHKKARILKSWERINSAYETQEIIKGYVKSRTKGGLIVDIFGIEAFFTRFTD